MTLHMSIIEEQDYIDTGNAVLYRQLFTYMEQLEDPARPRTPVEEAKPYIGDTALYIQPFTYLL